MTQRQRREVMKAMGLGAVSLAAAAPVLAEAGTGGKAAKAPRPVRRIVTGHDAQGRSTFISDGAPPRPHQRTAGSVTVNEIWLTSSTPADNSGSAETADGPMKIMPPKNGSVFRIVDFPPEAQHREALSRELKMGDDGSGVVSALAHGGSQRLGFHRTDTIDYAVVISGEIYAQMDDGEKLMHAGDVLVQRGTSHAWVNRSKQTARIAFVLIDAKPAV